MNRVAFNGSLLPNVDHITHTYSHEHMAYSKGEPTWGAHLAEDLERVVALHDPSTIAAVIIEPVAGSSGVVPLPAGYLQKIRDICTKHDILLIFDEVITGFGRLGDSFATVKFGVTPDMITCAKGLTNAAVPAGAVICQGKIFDTIQQAVHQAPGTQIELLHGYTYSGHPLAMAAGIANLEVIKEQQLFEKAAALSPYFQEALHSLKGLPHVIDIRNIGLMGAVELEPSSDVANRRSFDIFDRCFEKGVFLRASAGTMIALSPPLLSEKKHIDQIVDVLGQAIKESAEKCPK